MKRRTTQRAARAKPKQRRSATIGIAPGSLIADPQAIAPSIHLIKFGPDQFDEVVDCSAEIALNARGSAPVVWIDVIGLADLDLISQIGDAFGLHGLALEDVVNVHQRPKVETYEDHLFIVHKQIKTGLLKGTAWEKQRIDQLLERLPEAERAQLRLAGRVSRGILIPKWEGAIEQSPSQDPPNQGGGSETTNGFAWK